MTVTAVTVTCVVINTKIIKNITRKFSVPKVFGSRKFLDAADYWIVLYLFTTILSPLTRLIIGLFYTYLLPYFRR